MPEYFYHHKKSLQQGFTLVEIALVLVIIGLIMGGLVIAQSTIRSAHIRDATGDVAKYTQAFNSFKDRFQALPGDFANAQNFWGTDPAGCPSPITGLPATPYTTTPKQATCNGNGDGHIGGTAAQYYESFRAWQQLFASGVLNNISSSPFNGISGTGGGVNAVLGVNVPSPSLREAGFGILWVSVPAGGNATNFSFVNNHELLLGTVYPNSITIGALFTPSEALSIDTKLDDGIPGSGTVQPPTNVIDPNCTISASQYNTGYTKIACGLDFITDF